MTDWEQKYLEDDTPWDRGEPAPPLVEYAETNPLSGRILIPGCGIGHDARFLAGLGCRVQAIDISDTALSKAKSFEPPPQGQLKFERVDFLDERNDLPDSHFDFVFEHTCFCAIDPSDRIRYSKAVKRALKPNGHLLGIFFTNLEDDDGPPYPTSHEEIRDLFAPDFDIVGTWQPKRSFPGRENEESLYLMKRR